MQHEAFANTEDFGGPDIVAGPGRAARPGQDAPYADYELGRPYDEMFAPDGKARAAAIYQKARPGYHPITQATVDGILK